MKCLSVCIKSLNKICQLKIDDKEEKKLSCLTNIILCDDEDVNLN
jgi:hypothetical protein